MIQLRRFFLLIAVSLLAAVPAYAEKAVPADMTAEDRIELTRIEDYLNGLTTAKADFTQSAADGTVSTGTFYLSRPGKLRFDYATPQKDAIIADGKFIWYYDAKLKDANHAPLSRTMANFLLRQDISLSNGDVTVVDYSQDNDAIIIRLTQTDDPGAGSLSIRLKRSPLQIVGWQVLDAQGRTTRVSLDHPSFGITLDPALFVWHDPEDK